MHHRFLAPLLIVVTIAVFWRAVSCQFINYDDPDYAAENPRVLQGLTPANAAWAFNVGFQANFHPLTWLSLMLDGDLTRLLGLRDHSAAVFHATNVVLHALAAALLYLALNALTGAAWRSGLVALLFAIHPLRVESVAWVSERKDVLSGGLAFATLLAYALYARRPHWGRYALVAVLFILGLLAKPMLVTLPCLFLLLDFWPLRRLAKLTLPAPSPHGPVCPPRSLAGLIVEKLPLLALSAASSVITFIAQREGNAVTSLAHLPLDARLANVMVAYVRYLGKMVWFRELIVVYPLRHEPLWKAGLAAAALAAITAGAVVRFRPNPWLLIGWLWYLGMLVPVIGLVQVGSQGFADRYTYLPTVGLLLMAVWSAPERLFATGLGRTTLAGLTAALAAYLAVSTWQQIGYWHDSLSLFSRAVWFDRDNPMALTCMGLAEEKLGRSKEAQACYEYAIAVSPRFALAQADLGVLLEHLAEKDGSQARMDQALEHLKAAALYEPDNLAAYNGIGVYYLRRGQFDQARKALAQALQIAPDFPVAHDNLGLVLMAQNQFAAAVAEFESSLRYDHEDYDIYFPLAKCLAHLGRFEETLPYLRGLIAHHRQEAAAYAAMGEALLQLHRHDEAVAALRKAVELEPGNEEFRALAAGARISAARFPRTLAPAASQPAMAR